MTDTPQSLPNTPNTPTQEWTKVWDPLVRISHWVLLVAVATALITRGEPESVHQWAGYVVAGYVMFRLFWGIAGPKRARFETFLASPLAGLTYVADLVAGKAKRHVGHSPAGGLMVIALLFGLSGSAATGMAMENHVPVPAFVASWVPIEGNEAGEASEEMQAGEAGEDESPWEEVHELFANLVLALAIIHVAGVGLASIKHRENLVRAMVTGRKRTG